MQPGERRALDPADPVLDPETVLRLAGRHVPVASAVLSVDESGGEARSYLLDDGTIFKTQRPHRVRGSTSIEKAAFFMQQLEGVDGVSVPRVLGYGREGTIEYVCESRMPGVAVRYADLDEASTSLESRPAPCFRRPGQQFVYRASRLRRRVYLPSGLRPPDVAKVP